MKKKLCTRCHNRPVRLGFRFCWCCLGRVKQEMRKAGYFQRDPRRYTDPEPRQ